MSFQPGYHIASVAGNRPLLDLLISAGHSGEPDEHDLTKNKKQKKKHTKHKYNTHILIFLHKWKKICVSGLNDTANCVKQFAFKVSH